MAITPVLHPVHPERICWGCDLFCPAGDLRCGNEIARAMHPSELFGDDWVEWSASRCAAALPRVPATPLPK